MLSVKTKECLDYNKFDDMSSEALKAVLQADFDAPEVEQLDIDTVIYITNLLLEREKANPQNAAKNVAVAKAEFYREYYPLTDNKELVRDIIGDVEETINSSAKHNKLTLGHSTPYKKIASMVAAILIVFCVGSVTAYAFGFGPIAKWNEDRFWFETVSVTTELANVVSDFNNSDNLVPTWLPKDYEFENVDIVNYSDWSGINSSFVKNTDNDTYHIFIDYYFNNANEHLTYEKIDKDVIKYTKNGIDHYIITNSNNITIVWLNGNFECSITGKITENEAKKMIDSIY